MSLKLSRSHTTRIVHHQTKNIWLRSRWTFKRERILRGGRTLYEPFAVSLRHRQGRCWVNGCSPGSSEKRLSRWRRWGPWKLYHDAIPPAIASGNTRFRCLQGSAAEIAHGEIRGRHEDATWARRCCSLRNRSVRVTRISSKNDHQDAGTLSGEFHRELRGLYEFPETLRRTKDYYERSK